MTALLFVAFIVFTIWGISSFIKRDVADAKAAREANEPALLNAAFDGRQDVTFVVRTGTPTVDVVVRGARERGYRLAHTLDTGSGRVSVESTLVFVREEGATPIPPPADLTPVTEGAAHDGPKARKGMSFGVMSVIGTVLFVAAVVSCSTGTSDSGGSGGRSSTPSGLTWGTATVACDRAGSSMNPYGFKVSWTTGGINSEVRGDEYHLKAEVRVTNASNATEKTVVECVVSGTRDNPKVESLHVY